MSNIGPLGTLAILHGSLIVKYSDKSLRARPGDVVILPPGERHLEITPGLKVTSIACQATWGDQTFILKLAQPILIKRDRAASLRKVINELVTATYGKKAEKAWSNAMRFEPRSLRHHISIQSALWSWFGQVIDVVDAADVPSTNKIHYDPRVTLLLHHIQDMPLDQPFSQKKLGDKIDISWRRLEQLFKEATRLTPHEYYERRRLRETHRLLIYKARPIKETAYAVGFKHLSHFSRWFTAHFGSSPRQYRRKPNLG